VHSFAVILLELMCLKRPFEISTGTGMSSTRLSRGETLGMNRGWPLPVQDTIRRSLSRDLKERPTMSESYKTLNDCFPEGVEYTDMESTNTMNSTQNQIKKKSFILLPVQLSSGRRFRVFSSTGVSYHHHTTPTQT